VSAMGRAWWTARSVRERRLLTASAILGAVVGVALVAGAVARDAASLRRRVAQAERRLENARILAGRLEAANGLGADAGGGSLVSVVEAAAVETLGRERLTRLDAGADPATGAEARLVDVTLADVVSLVAALEDLGKAVLVRDLDLRRRPDARDRYDATIVVVAGRWP
jgi:hypothetical protein